jgi:hypothetical protein
MPTEVENLREMARKFWRGEEIYCERHPGVKMAGSFVQTTFADHVFLACPKGKETITIPQRPRQVEFHAQQVIGMVENIQRGDSNLCFRCQAKLEVEAHPLPLVGPLDGASRSRQDRQSQKEEGELARRYAALVIRQPSPVTVMKTSDDG